MSNITYISVDKLDPHPDNPRKQNLGSLTELSDSIKANGIFQNLTVVPWFSAITYAPCDDDKMEGHYRIVIGHRRLEAAKLAGLTEVPCVISDMPLPEQVRTMLMENMQRSDLTPYEQAEGFQMMLNLGDSLDDIAVHTGFSESTIRRRVKLLELDADKFKESSERGATLFDYVELEKIRDIDKRNAVLENVGTDNFKCALKKALDAQETADKVALLVERLSSFATMIESTKDSNYSYVKYISASTDLEEISTPEDADTTPYFFTLSGSWAQLYKEKTASAEEDAAKAERDAAEATRAEKCDKLNEISARAFALRYEFMKSVSVTTIKKKLSAIIKASLAERMGYYNRFDDEMFCRMLELTSEEDDDKEQVKARLLHAVSELPEKALLYAAYCDYHDSSANNYHQHYYGTHSVNASLNGLYELLDALGYRISDEEEAMRSGTHELFDVAEKPDEDLMPTPDLEQAA